jgi:hypothetical protein
MGTIVADLIFLEGFDREKATLVNDQVPLRQAIILMRILYCGFVKELGEEIYLLERLWNYRSFFGLFGSFLNLYNIVEKV